jgi:hypothetical protein
MRRARRRRNRAKNIHLLGGIVADADGTSFARVEQGFHRGGGPIAQAPRPTRDARTPVPAISM